MCDLAGCACSRVVAHHCCRWWCRREAGQGAHPSLCHVRTASLEHVLGLCSGLSLGGGGTFVFSLRREQDPRDAATPLDVVVALNSAEALGVAVSTQVGHCQGWWLWPLWVHGQGLLLTMCAPSLEIRAGSGGAQVCAAQRGSGGPRHGGSSAGTRASQHGPAVVCTCGRVRAGAGLGEDHAW